jgi:hypothetical protein
MLFCELRVASCVLRVSFNSQQAARHTEHVICSLMDRMKLKSVIFFTQSIGNIKQSLSSTDAGHCDGPQILGLQSYQSVLILVGNWMMHTLSHHKFRK